MCTLESLVSTPQGGWMESHWEILLLQYVHVLDIARTLHTHCYYLSGWFYCETMVVRSTKECRTLHQGSNTVSWYLVLPSPFIKEEKIPCLPLEAVELLGLGLASGISIQS